MQRGNERKNGEEEGENRWTSPSPFSHPATTAHCWCNETGGCRACRRLMPSLSRSPLPLPLPSPPAKGREGVPTCPRQLLSKPSDSVTCAVWKNSLDVCGGVEQRGKGAQPPEQNP